MLVIYKPLLRFVRLTAVISRWTATAWRQVAYHQSEVILVKGGVHSTSGQPVGHCNYLQSAAEWKITSQPLFPLTTRRFLSYFYSWVIWTRDGSCVPGNASWCRLSGRWHCSFPQWSPGSLLEVSEHRGGSDKTQDFSVSRVFIFDAFPVYTVITWSHFAHIWETDSKKLNVSTEGRGRQEMSLPILLCWMLLTAPMVEKRQMRGQPSTSTLYASTWIQFSTTVSGYYKGLVTKCLSKMRKTKHQ